MQVLRVCFAVALAGCVTYNGRQPDDPNAGDAGGDAGDETLSQATDRVITTWQSCMTVEDVDITDLAPTWSGITTQDNQMCANCHGGGGYGFLATPNPQVLATTLQSNRSHLLQYLTVDLTKGAADAAMIVNSSVQMAVSSGQPPHAEHPRFMPSVGLDTSEQFRLLVQARLDSGACGD